MPVEEKAPITGVLAPAVTPFKPNLSPDAERFVKHCRWLLSNNVGLAIFGTTSEGNSLAVDQKIELLDRLVAEGIDPARMMPGTGACALADAARLTAYATKLGCAGVLMLPPFYYKTVSDEGLFRSFAEVIESVGDSRLRIYLYNIPPVSQVAITLPLIERLLKSYPAVIAGAKDSSGDWKTTKAYLDNFATQGFAVFPGSESFLLQALKHGGAGCISATANVNPRAIDQLYTSWQGADADAQQHKLDEIRNIFAKYPMVPALKATIARFTKDQLWTTCAPPLVELSSDQTTSLYAELDRVGFTMPG